MGRSKENDKDHWVLLGSKAFMETEDVSSGFNTALGMVPEHPDSVPRSPQTCTCSVHRGTAQGTRRGTVVIWGLLSGFGIKGEWEHKKIHFRPNQLGTQELGEIPAARFLRRPPAPSPYTPEQVLWPPSGSSSSECCGVIQPQEIQTPSVLSFICLWSWWEIIQLKQTRQNT